MEKVLLLGASGLLGRNVLEELLKRGIPTRLLVRRPLGVPGAEERIGSLLRREALQAAVEGCSAIINCAGTTDMTLPCVEDFYPVNRDLPMMLCEVALQAGVRTLVHTSTANTLQIGLQEQPATEETPFGPPYDTSPYALSKKAGEDAVLAFSRQHPALRTVVVNPGFMVGPFDSKPSSGQLLLAAYRKPLMFALPGAKSYLPVKDAARAIVNALSQGEGRYLLTGRCLSMKAFFQLQARVCGYRQRCVEVPAFAVRLAGAVGILCKALKIKTMLYPHNIRQMLCEEWYSSEKAQRELGYQCTSLEQAVADFYAWREASE
ncbi:MAG: NAD-dependent epimerase/dehydratase family protein [Bacteroidales bacterium]|nr:NAD-dependent epimerase/dehydratase family protein [Bacteroidales bacterium]